MASFPRPRLAVLGAGFLGRFVADEARRAGWEVLPVVRSEASAARLRHEYPGTMAIDAVESGFWLKHAPACDGMVWAIAPSRGSSEEEFKRVHTQGAVRAAEWAGKRKIPYVYISSTSVYAEESGGWVDEDSVMATDPRATAMTADNPGSHPETPRRTLAGSAYGAVISSTVGQVQTRLRSP